MSAFSFFYQTCVYVYICMYMCVCVCVCVCLCLSLSLSIYIYIKRMLTNQIPLSFFFSLFLLSLFHHPSQSNFVLLATPEKRQYMHRSDRCKVLLIDKWLVCPYKRVLCRKSLMCLIVFLQKFSACLARFSTRVCEMRGKWTYNYYSVGCCFKDLLDTACSVFM